MARLSTYLPDNLIELLQKDAEAGDKPVARVLRRILEQHYGLAKSNPPKPTGKANPIAETPQKPEPRKRPTLDRAIKEEHAFKKESDDRCKHKIPAYVAFELEQCGKCALEGLYGPERQAEAQEAFNKGGMK